MQVRVSAQRYITSIDSALVSEIERTSGDARINKVKKLVQYYVNTSPTNGERWIEEGINYSRSVKDEKTEADFMLLNGKICLIRSQYRDALDYYQKALLIYNKLKSENEIASCYNEIAYVSNYIGEFQKGLEYSYKAEKLATEIKDQINQADAFNNISISNYLLKDSLKAEQYYKKALALSKQIDYPIGLAAAYVHKSIYLFSAGQFDNGLEYAFMALDEYKRVDYRRGIAGTLENIALLYRKKKEFTKSLNYHNQSLEIKGQIGDKQGIAATYANIGLIYWDTNDREKAKIYFQKSYDLRYVLGDLRGLGVVSDFFSQLFEEEGNYKESLRYYKLYKTYQDTLFNEKKQIQINMLSAQYESEKKESQIKQLEADNALNKTIFYYLLIIAILAISVAILFGVLIQKNKKTNQILIRKNEQITEQKELLEKLNSELSLTNAEKDKLFAIIAHDLKSPFQSILGFSDIITTESDKLSKEEILNYFQLISESNNNLYELIENLLSWSLIKMGKLKINPEPFTPIDDINKIIRLYHGNLHEKNISVNLEASKEDHLNIDRNSFMIILRNLISNSIKYTKSGGSIDITAHKSDGVYELKVRDSGVGMSEEVIEDILSKDINSTSGTRGEKGTGFGLMICLEMIERNNGKLDISSTPGKGTEFKVIFNC
ncbi:MAG: sensor histidine kinase [Ignavibacteriales bacterium]|nr:sensor histidine kinase [Ignavibacteriales bacterium]HOJ18060.1 tetratricopeptide repeat-containing sensor histidine kinase [Ignavibacteriaceae bacterium]HPO56256.1 tetratricopeptide repeat-containing sensor histidine kinase [Ignavibacteriaceae bacterium]